MEVRRVLERRGEEESFELLQRRLKVVKKGEDSLLPVLLEPLARPEEEELLRRVERQLEGRLGCEEEEEEVEGCATISPAPGT